MCIGKAITAGNSGRTANGNGPPIRFNHRAATLPEMLRNQAGDRLKISSSDRQHHNDKNPGTAIAARWTTSSEAETAGISVLATIIKPGKAVRAAETFSARAVNVEVDDNQ